MLSELFNINRKKIDDNAMKLRRIEEKSEVSSFTYGFPLTTLAEANAFITTDVEFRFITNARKSGEGVGLGTGLPAFFNPSTSTWVDFLGTAITV